MMVRQVVAMTSPEAPKTVFQDLGIEHELAGIAILVWKVRALEKMTKMYSSYAETQDASNSSCHS